jgi:Abnormal spindle-like microcephaly-assoc'd, ASPM-SPD-2-Hydin
MQGLFGPSCTLQKSAPFRFAALLTVLLIPLLSAQAQTPPQINTWYGNTPDYNAILGVTAQRLGCTSTPDFCIAEIGQVASSQNVPSVYLSIGLYPDTSASYAGQLSQWSVTNPVLYALGFDDLVNRMWHLQNDDGIAVPGTVVTDTLNAVKSANANLKFAVTIYEDQLTDPLLSDSNLPASTRNAIDYIELYVHYRADGPNYATYVQQTKALFPNAQIIAGVYAYDRIDYLPCQPAGSPCTVQQEEDFFQQLFLIQLNELQQGVVAAIEFLPGNFGIEAQWPEWSQPNYCAPSRLQQCLADTLEMRQTALQDLATTFGEPGPLTSLSPRPLAFTVQNIGTTSGASTVTLNNPGTAPVNISSISISGGNASEFSQQNSCPAALAPNTNCSINVTFTPAAVGTRSSQLVVTSNERRSPDAMQLTGVGAIASSPQVSLAPPSLNFKTQTVGTTSSPSALLLANPGGSALSISNIAVSGSSATQFAQTNNCGSSVASGGNCTINITFTPATAADQAAELVITDNAAGSPHTAPLTGIGVVTAPAQVTLSNTVLAFNNEMVGTTSTAQSVSVSNPGTTALAISQISLSGTNVNDFAQTNTCGSTLAGGANCTLTITFDPSATGARSASLLIADNAAGSPQSIALSGTGTPAAAPAATLSPGSVTFSSQTVQTSSAATPVTLSNTGNAALTVASMVISGANAGDFAQTNTCVGTIAPAASCSIAIVFTPAAAGSRAAEVIITDNASGSPQQVALSGTGTNAIPANFALSASPQSANLAAGQAAVFTLSVTSSGGFNQAVQLACSGLPAEASCSFSPATVTPSASAAGTTRMTVATAPQTANLFPFGIPGGPFFKMMSAGLSILCLLLCLHRIKNSIEVGRHAVLGPAFASTVLLVTAALGGCGKSTSSTPPVSGGTPAGTYSVIVTGTSGSLSQQAVLSLTVQQ